MRIEYNHHYKIGYHTSHTGDTTAKVEVPENCKFTSCKMHECA